MHAALVRVSKASCCCWCRLERSERAAGRLRALARLRGHRQRHERAGGALAGNAGGHVAGAADGGMAAREQVQRAVDNAVPMLPHQPILENFVHHNPLASLQSMTFDEALARVEELETYMSPGERAYSLTGVDPRKREQDALADLCAVFLDRGAAKWGAGFRDRGFLSFFATLEGMGPALWREHARHTARHIAASLPHDDPGGAAARQLSERLIMQNLVHFGVPIDNWDDCVLSMLLKVRGWAGMFHRMETHPEEAPETARVALVEFCAVQSILSRSAIEAVAKQASWKPGRDPLASWLAKAPTRRSPPVHPDVQSSSAIAQRDQSAQSRVPLELAYQRELLQAVAASAPPATTLTGGQERRATAVYRPEAQVCTCIDDREGSLRRHVEENGANTGFPIDTFGVAGFFGLPVRFRSVDSFHEAKLCPDGQTPAWSGVETERAHSGDLDTYKTRRRVLVGHLGAAWERMSFSPVGSLLLSTLAPISMMRLVLMGFAPSTKNAIHGAFLRWLLRKPPTDIEFPIAPADAATMLAGTFKSSGLTQTFAPLVMVLGHGGSSVNNPFYAAYNCGACSGHSGGINARLFARLANDHDVRAELLQTHEIRVPEDTVFVGGEHDTGADTVTFYDEDQVPPSHSARFEKTKRVVQDALGANALERCHRFLLARVHNPVEALSHVHTRSVDPAEVRPELNHSTNAAVVVGRRTLTRGQFFDRRAFLVSYEPAADDDKGTLLESVLGPALQVCSGINLEYLFSTVATDRYGAGTKVPLNVVGNIGVQQGTYGDLRTGLPSQMVEMHMPLRAMFVVDAPLTRVEAVLQRRPELAELVQNQWVRMAVRDPLTGSVHTYDDGVLRPASLHGSEPLNREQAWAKFAAHRKHGMETTRREGLVYHLSVAGMLASVAAPLMIFDASELMNPHGPLIATCATGLALPVLAFSRRYLHGEFMFSRVSLLSTGLLAGFNLVALAPSLEHMLTGWGLFGFASTFLIGSYNDRPTVRNNATYAFAAYRLSDFALLTAAALASPVGAAAVAQPELVAGCLLFAALSKSSQFPLTALFARSMEGPTPTSALGYAGLSAHVGVVLLASTMDLWFQYDFARVVLGSIGAYTAVSAGAVSKIHADRKGSIAYATSSTLGLIYTVMAAGYPEAALCLSFGHAAFRMTQILRSSNTILETERVSSALGQRPWPRAVPDWLFRLCWRLHRLDTDIHAVNILHRLSSPLQVNLNLSRVQQWVGTGVGVAVAGMPGLPVSSAVHDCVMHLLPTHPALAVGIMAGHFGVSVLAVRFLLLNVLSSARFRPPEKNDV